jgi:hypothetical protein
MLRLLSIVPIVLLLGACAPLSVVKDGDGEGYDVYRPEPYLLVSGQNTKTTVVGPAQKSDALNEFLNTDAKSSPDAASPDKSANSPSPVASIIWLPNYGERYRVKMNKCFFLVSSQLQVSIQDGWMLSAYGTQGDNSSLINAIASLGSAALGGAKAAAPSTTTTPKKEKAETLTAESTTQPTSTTTTEIKPEAHLYKILFTSDGSFYGLSNDLLHTKTDFPPDASWQLYGGNTPHSLMPFPPPSGK